MTEETITIEMPEEALKTIESVMPPEEKPKEQTEPYSVDENGKAQCKLCNMILADEVTVKKHVEDAHPVFVGEEKKEEPTPDPNRNEKGQFVEGNRESVGNSGKPCQFCKHAVETTNKVMLYSNWTLGKVDGKYHVPFLEELCDEDYLDIHTDTLHDWTNGKHAEEHHSELIHTIRKLVMRQKKLLLKRTLTDSQVAGAIFQLKANHGLMEAEKKVLVGDKNSDPMEFVITEERRIPDGEQD